MLTQYSLLISINVEMKNDEVFLKPRAFFNNIIKYYKNTKNLLKYYKITIIKEYKRI